MTNLATRNALLLITAISVHLSLSPPNPPVALQKCTGSKTLFERFIQYITFCSKPTSLVASLFCPEPPRPLSTMWTVHSGLLIGSSMAFLAALLRLWCFRTMGRMFTFEVTIDAKHELITGGPYAYVRHPSYTGVAMTLLGATLALCSPGSWLMECGVLSRGGILALAFWIVKCGYAAKGTIARLGMEDETLRKTFGSTWDEYAENVPYRLIPGVI
ncbi:hypothetical protein PLEOSDRAFT_1049839 [Pleurotus ostreatus PC15]|uniref:Protein-S-isoprenylcysteine O-methyltransferase n=1 Tax=Pleurotus ostreatus (strain PC15) TaxID=1137138 RepID=A0A067N4X1_PLEO1|nr:hypothetical protein PLEOSDRAFT_1049839 [Pleurotus ostreatus PC15]